MKYRGTLKTVMNEKVNVSNLTRRKNAKKISDIEVVAEIKYLGVIVQGKRNVFEGKITK